MYERDEKAKNGEVQMGLIQ